MVGTMKFMSSYIESRAFEAEIDKWRLFSIECKGHKGVFEIVTRTRDPIKSRTIEFLLFHQPYLPRRTTSIEEKMELKSVDSIDLNTFARKLRGNFQVFVEQSSHWFHSTCLAFTERQLISRHVARSKISASGIFVADSNIWVNLNRWLTSLKRR